MNNAHIAGSMTW